VERDRVERGEQRPRLAHDEGEVWGALSHYLGDRFTAAS
jgi:hypothetical protein